MTPAELAELLAIAEDTVSAAEAAFLERAKADAEPSDWAAYLRLLQARRLVSAVIVLAGVMDA